MILEIDCGEQKVKVEISSDRGRKKIVIDGRETDFDWVRLPTGQFSLILEGRVYDFFVDHSEENYSISGRNGTYALRVSDTRRLKLARDVDPGQAGLQRIAADMPGKVIRLLVKEGDRVEYDQGLLVLEAMKMQNEIRAPKSGTVKEIGVKAGMVVGSGEFLLSLE